MHSRSQIRKIKTFANHTILLSEEIFMIFDYCVHNRSYIYLQDIWIQKCVLDLIFANTFKITKFANLKDS